MNSESIVNITNEETRDCFLRTMEDWLTNHNYEYVVKPDNTKHDLDKLNLEYVGIWRWDLALFLNDANISAYKGGQRVGEIKYKAPNNLNMNKYSSAEKRIGYMMDGLFRKSTIDEINEKLISKNVEQPQ